MSIDRHIHLGPYVEIVYTPPLVEKLARGCPNKGCSGYPRNEWSRNMGKHCSYCGVLQTDVAMTVPERIDTYRVVGDSLTPAGSAADVGGKTVVRLVPNLRRGADREFFQDGEDTHLDLTSFDTNAEIAWFTNAYAADLTKLDAAYETVTVRWGLHCWTD